jgi:hypothetical protein
MPAEIRQIDTQAQTSLKQVLAGLYFVWFVIDINS